MTGMDALQCSLYFIVLLIFIKPLGWYMAQVYEGKPCGLDRILGPIERLIYRFCGISPERGMQWIAYLSAMLAFNLIGLLVVYAILRWQAFFPINPQTFPGVAPDLSFNTAVSFVTNTNWQAYGGETTMSYFSQMAALTVQNFLSAATGLSLLVALIRGIRQRESTALGNFWVDMVRSVLYILLPLAILLSLALVSQGVIQTLRPNQTATLIQPFQYQEGTKTQTTQVIPMGPVASQVAIKQLGTNGGGFFNTNSAHPFENPTPMSNFLEMLAILLIPAALCYTFGLMVRDRRQGRAILIAMFLLLIPLTAFIIVAEHQETAVFNTMGIDETSRHHLAPGGNMEGKETRLGTTNSALWASITTATSNGSVNAMLDSFTPMGGFVPLFLMHLGEVAFGGVGSGLYTMLIFIILTVFIAGLMVGRTPEYLGKKIEPFEMKMAAVAVLVMPLVVLLFTAIACVTNAGVSAIGNPKAHGFSEILYAFTSMGNNNGSAFAGLNANNMFYNTVGGIAMLIARFWIAIPTLAIAGSLASKKRIPSSLGTLPTHTPLFITLLCSVIIVVGALSFIPALTLGPVVEQLLIWRPHGN